MKDHTYLQYCLFQIEEKFDWGKSQSWKETEFLRLSEIISKETEISISPHTLKRLYGKIKYKEHYNPQRATKDALAKFIGYANWGAFITYYDDEIRDEPQKVKPRFWKQKRNKIGFVALAGFVLILFLIQWTDTIAAFGNKEHESSFTFNTNDTIAKAPHTVSVRYNIENVESDSTYLDFDFDHPITGPAIKNLDNQRSLYNYTYQIPGYYHIKLTSQGQHLDGKNILVTSEDWFSYYYPEGKQVLWLDNQIKTLKEDGYLYQTSESLLDEGFDINSVYYVEHRIFKNFQIDGDNFEMKVRFKNSEKSGGITCYDFFLTLFCEKDIASFSLMEKGCSSYSGIKVGKLELNGVDEDLSSLTFDSDCWNNLSVTVRENRVKVFINKELVFSNTYEGSNGNIVGIGQLFKGTGKLDYLRIKDLGTNKEFFDDFEEVIK
ncbi:hypothetical protein SAMN05660776_0898 [Salegentibacter holothuriorum]|uniref:PKD domain-containing protein n=1 Tax=Salegentibacter holothuriorum TaxID=241145 RepID=A0A1T5AW17_9FLAO|nr:hypothetical protein [Salegentibacter holothuriorum]SKB38970.1 hypothetical protein SAMN05660776_0898 [Salegentibacter holothuriorum]